MQLGWIDFSKEDKSKAISVIHSLTEPGVLDELGFGAIRDAFANDFFPGTSTLHTRSKYFYILPYLLFEIQKKCSKGTFSTNGNAATFIKKLREEIDSEEKKTKNLLLKNGNLDGVIGSSTTDEKYWVERTPIIIYWSGLRTFGFFENQEYSSNITYSELLANFYRIAQNKSNLKATATDNNENTNDSDAGGTVFFPIGKEFNKPEWRNDISIKLTKEEATDLKNRMINSEGSKNSLLAFILQQNLNLEGLDFKTFTEAYEEKFPDDLREKITLANNVNDFYYLTMLRYNFLLGQIDFENCNLDIQNEWEDILPSINEICKNFNPNKTFMIMNIQNNKLRDFLICLRDAFLDSTKNGDFSKVDFLITEREKTLKTTRAKIQHPEKYDVKKLLNFPRFDYRFRTVQQHVKDIQEGEKNAEP